MLRIYPLPYVNIRLTGEDLVRLTELAAELKHDCPDLRSYQYRLADDKMACALACARAYERLPQFESTKAASFRWDSKHDFTYGQSKIKILPSRVNPDWENSGPRTAFRLNVNAYRKSDADTFVLAAFNMPFVQLVGWLNKEEVAKYVQGYTLRPYASCLLLRAMHDHPIEKARRGGQIV